MVAHTAQVDLYVYDAEAHPVVYAVIQWTQDEDFIGGVTDEAGRWTGDLPSGTWTVNVSCIGFEKYIQEYQINSEAVNIEIGLMPSGIMLSDVVVTAREGMGMTSTSLIDHAAMEHLQPSSFTDLLELLPGNVAKNPQMGEVNLANLRMATVPGDDYATSSLGTSFVVDGVPINTNSDLTISPESLRSGRSTVGKGVDMRSLSTDDIESVEIVRGIASAEYGEVTSGVINIRRKKRASALEARFKADQLSQLFYLGKGLSVGQEWNLNFSVDYLDSRIDPRNNRENFKRVTASVRSDKTFVTSALSVDWSMSLNYTGTFERDKNDPDLTVNNTIDYYTSDKNTISWNNSLSFTKPGVQFFDNLTVTTGVSYGYEHLIQQKTVAGSRIYPMPVSTTPGSNDVGFLPLVYLADYDLYSRPVTVFAKTMARFRYNIGGASSTLKTGMEWGFNKNYGKGEVYDLERPLIAGNNSRPRPFSDIPAMNRVAVFVENLSNVNVGQNDVELQLGLRETQLVGMPRGYTLNGYPYFDPRVNLKWTFPIILINQNPLVISAGGGFGIHTKMPVAAQLYPDLLYTDYVQLNYYHNNPDWRTVNVMTFVEDISNKRLKAARNYKWEIRGDLSYRGNRFSLTFFNENMTDGFRSNGVVHIYTYRQYDASGFNPSIENRPPIISELPWQEVNKISIVGEYNNGSHIDKRGVEFTFSSLRIPYIRTRLTVNGAYFRTLLDNSCAQWYHPSVIVDGQQFPYAGLYSDSEGSVYKTFNTNILLDTDIPRLKLNFSVGIQNMWFTSHRMMFKSGIPSHYMDIQGNVYPFTPDVASDPLIGQLIRSYSPTSFLTRRVPTQTDFNIKATKKLWHDRLAIAVYVNRLLTIAPEYYSFGILQRRYSSPYFGMELNIKI